MKYVLRLSEVCAEVVPLVYVAEAKARRDACAGGMPLHKPTYKGKLAGYFRALLNESRSGRLLVCDATGVPGKVDDLIEAESMSGHLSYVRGFVEEPDWESHIASTSELVEGSGVRDLTSVALGLSELDADATQILCLYSRLKWLNDWGAVDGDEYEINSDGVPWIDERGEVTPSSLQAAESHAATGEASAKENEPSPVCRVFREMENLRPGEVSINFVAGESGGAMLNISARGIIKRVSLAEFDLFDRRRAAMNKQAGILLALAKGLKVSTVDNTHSKSFSRIRKIFKKHLGITTDPFERSTKAPLFSLADTRDAADKRAEHNALKKTQSIHLANVQAEVDRQSARRHDDYDDDGNCRPNDTDAWLADNS